MAKGFWIDWWARQDSNLQPTSYEPAALPLSYGPPFHAASNSLPEARRTCKGGKR